jgi:hypothetical protein
MRCSPNGAVWHALQEHSYAYLLAMYLGDGCLLNHPRDVKRLSVALDLRYPVIIDECEAAMSIVMPDNRVRRQPMQLGAQGLYVNSLSKHWPCLFPQHGPGPKHMRSIELEEWQRKIVERHPGRFVRGLVHSDGSRSTNTIRTPKKTYRYPRYEFSNRSDQIRGLFVWGCSLLGVEAKPMGRWSVSVARRELVAILDRHVGPKR